MSPYRKILIADPYPVFRYGLSRYLAQSSVNVATFEADSLDTLIESLECYPDISLLVLGEGLTGTYGMSGVICLADRYPDLPILFVAESDRRESVQKTADLGISAIVHKGASLSVFENMISCLLNNSRTSRKTNSVYEVRPVRGGLTHAERRVLQLLVKGFVSNQIASELGIKVGTVKTHISNMLRKLSLKNRTQLVLLVRGQTGGTVYG